MLFGLPHLILYGAVAALIGWIVYTSYLRHVALSKIEKLGGRAAVVPVKLPLGAFVNPTDVC